MSKTSSSSFAAGGGGAQLGVGAVDPPHVAAVAAGELVVLVTAAVRDPELAGGRALLAAPAGVRQAAAGAKAALGLAHRSRVRHTILTGRFCWSQATKTLR